MTISLRTTAFNPYDELQLYQNGALGQQGKYGATASFVGTMRDFNEGETVSKMTLEHYPGMTERYLDRILQEARQRWNFIDALIIHRVGEIEPNEPIVLVAVWSSHRGAAFKACRYLMEALKSKAPLWKKETLPAGAGERWVEHNTVGL